MQKTNVLFHKGTMWDSVLFQIPTMTFNNTEVNPKQPSVHLNGH